MEGDLSETNKKWQDDWFYISDVQFGNPPLPGLVEGFTLDPPIKRTSCSAKHSPDDLAEVDKLHAYLRMYAAKGLMLLDVMLVALQRGIQPLELRAHPMHMYTGKEDDTVSIPGEFFEGKSIQEMRTLFFKGGAADFPTNTGWTGFSSALRPKKVTVPSFI